MLVSQVCGDANKNGASKIYFRNDSSKILVTAS